jgi:ABC-2 type transport system ATP-binding protein
VVLRQLPSVAAVFETPLPGNRTRLRLTPRGNDPLLEAVAAAVRQSSLPVLELYEDRGNLDDVFRLITTGSAAQAA